MTRGLKTISRDYEHLGIKPQMLGAQLMVSSVLPADSQHPMREWRTVEVNHWLKGWCHQEHFRFLDRSSDNLYEVLLTRDGLNLPRTGKNVFGKQLTCLILEGFKLKLEGESGQ